MEDQLQADNESHQGLKISLPLGLGDMVVTMVALEEPVVQQSVAGLVFKADRQVCLRSLAREPQVEINLLCCLSSENVLIANYWFWPLADEATDAVLKAYDMTSWFYDDEYETISALMDKTFTALDAGLKRD